MGDHASAARDEPGHGHLNHRRLVAGVFPSWDVASVAIDDLKAIGVPDEQLGLAVHEDGDHGLSLDAARSAEHAGSQGALVGVPVGALAGIAVLAFVVPGVGAIGLGGALVAGGAGAAVGALVGGVTGSTLHRGELGDAEALEALPLEPGQVMVVVRPPDDGATHLWVDERGEMAWGDLVAEIEAIVERRAGRLVVLRSDEAA